MDIEKIKLAQKKYKTSEKGKEIRRKTDKKWRKKNTVKIKGYNKKHYVYDREYFRTKNLMNKYGITVEQFDSLLEEQEGKCAICKQPETSLNIKGNVRLLSVDHNHTTGKVRGLLCTTCNTAIGGFQESTELLLEAIKYITTHNG